MAPTHKKGKRKDANLNNRKSSVCKCGSKCVCKWVSVCIRVCMYELQGQFSRHSLGVYLHITVMCQVYMIVCQYRLRISFESIEYIYVLQSLDSNHNKDASLGLAWHFAGFDFCETPKINYITVRTVASYLRCASVLCPPPPVCATTGPLWYFRKLTFMQATALQFLNSLGSMPVPPTLACFLFHTAGPIWGFAIVYPVVRCIHRSGGSCCTCQHSRGAGHHYFHSEKWNV